MPESGGVYSAGDYDPFCCQKCHDDHIKELWDEMGRVNNMTDEQFKKWMMPWD